MKDYFREGAISADFIAQSIAKHQTKHNIGAHAIFLGQVRADEVNGQKVKAIDYTCYRDMANKEIDAVKEKAFEKFNLTCAHIYHSLGQVNAGEICLFVFVSSGHRKESFKASEYIVEEIKKLAPIFGKEIFEDETHQWKENKFD